MGLLDWLLTRKSKPLPPTEMMRDTSDGFMSVASRQFAGHFSASPNGCYRIAWGQGGWTPRNLAASRTMGRYLLLEGNTVLAEGQMTRPEGGQVANNGKFIINDWEDGSALTGSFVAFDRTGREIIRRHFNANLFNNGLSTDGHFAACHTCNSYDPDDSAILAVFDLSAGQEVARWQAESGWPNWYEFSADGKTIGLGYKELGAFRYSLTGDFIDRDIWVETCLAKGQYGTTILMVESLIKAAGKELPAKLASKLISSLDRFAPQFGTADPQWRALALKLRGIRLEASGAVAEALGCYERALELNPKIGVKRRAHQLKEQQGTRASETVLRVARRK
jgi:tetratricopeptide (TPR) repeat protein